MTEAADRVLAHADRLDRLKERYRYLGGGTAESQAAGARATQRHDQFTQLVADLREVANGLNDLREHAGALLDGVTHDDSGAMVGGQWQGGNGSSLSRETIKAADAVRKSLRK